MTTPSTEINREILEVAKTHNVPQKIYENVEYQKMISGMIYNSLDAELTDARTIAHEEAENYNDMRAKHFGSLAEFDTARERAIEKLFGSSGTAGRVEQPVRIDYGYNIKVGDNFYANFGLTILDCSLVTIGDNCMCAPNVTICTATHPLNARERITGVEFAHPISIGDNVWLGANVVVLPGVTIGDNAVIAAGAVVNRDVEANTVVAGVPARKIREIDNTNMTLDDPDLD